MLLKMYANGEYDTKTFCSTFCELYFFENNGRSCFPTSERNLLDDFSSIVERFTDEKEDLREYPDTYCDENKVKEAFEILIKALNKN